MAGAGEMAMDRGCNSSLFWLGIDAEGGSSEWEALVRRRLEEARAQTLTAIPIERAAQPPLLIDRLPQAA